MEFNTNDYVCSHAKAPRGYGSWAFTFDKHPSSPMAMAEVFMVHSATYAEAKKAARAEGAKRKARVAYVCG